MNARVGCVVLAAGESRRFGGANKLLLQLAGKPLLQRAIDTATQSQAMSCAVVLGAGAEGILNIVDPRRCVTVQNHRWYDGLTTSIHYGLALHENDDACIFMVADQPFVTVQDLNRLMARFVDRRTSIVALRAAGIWGTPMLFPHLDFRALTRLHGDSGAKRYAQRHLRRVHFVDAQFAQAFEDVDSPVDYKRLLQKVPRK